MAPFDESSSKIISSIAAPLVPFEMVLGRFDNGDPSWVASEAVLLTEDLLFGALMISTPFDRVPFVSTPLDSTVDFFRLGMSDFRVSSSHGPVMSRLFIGLSPMSVVLRSR